MVEVFFADLHAVVAEVRNYDMLCAKEISDEIEEDQDFIANLNPNSLEVLDGCKVEPTLKDAAQVRGSNSSDWATFA